MKTLEKARVLTEHLAEREVASVEPRLYICGLLDEVEFWGDHPDCHGRVVYGPFFSYDEAKDYARTLSIDPDEAVVVPVLPPTPREVPT